MHNTAKLTLESAAGDGMRFRVRAGDLVDSALDTGPRRSAPNPMEALLFALAGCQAMDVIGILRKKRQRVTGYEVEAVGERGEEHPRRFTRVTIVHRLTGHEVNAKAVEDAIHLSHTKYCSVQGSLDPSIEVVHRIEILPA